MRQYRLSFTQANGKCTVHTQWVNKLFIEEYMIHAEQVVIVDI